MEGDGGGSKKKSSWSHVNKMTKVSKELKKTNERLAQELAEAEAARERLARDFERAKARAEEVCLAMDDLRKRNWDLELENADAVARIDELEDAAISDEEAAVLGELARAFRRAALPGVDEEALATVLRPGP